MDRVVIAVTAAKRTNYVSRVLLSPAPDTGLACACSQNVCAALVVGVTRRPSYGGRVSPPLKTRNFGPRRGCAKEYWEMLCPANLSDFDRWERRGSSVAVVVGGAEKARGVRSVPVAGTVYV